jgi:GAF domain-containing protein
MTKHPPEVEAVLRIPVVDAMLEEVCRITGMGFAAVAHVTSERWIACQVLDKIELGLDPGDELDIKTTICDEIRDSGQAVFIDEVAADPYWRSHPVPVLYGFKSYISVPIVLEDGSFFGTLCAIDPARSAVKLSEILPVIEAYARDIALALSKPAGRA